MINEIKTALKSKLDEIDEIYGNELYIKKIEGYPFGFLKYNGSSINFIENRGILINHNFLYSVILNYNDEQKSEEKVCELTDLIISKLYEDVTLNNTIQYLQIGSVDTILDDENGRTKQIVFGINTNLINNF